jgi:hypothetical protein
VSPPPTSGPCCLNANTGYTGQENQLYRVAIHQGGPLGTATFKWSRENASVITAVTGINKVTNTALKPASQLTVNSLGRDQILGFNKGDWIEIIDDYLELNGTVGELHSIDSLNAAAKTITLDSPVSSTNFPVTGGLTDASRHTRIRRWDQKGTVYDSNQNTVVVLGSGGNQGDIPIAAGGNEIVLENGVTVSFSLSNSSGLFLAGDFWAFAARATDGTVEIITQAPPQGIHHHYAKLSVVSFGPPISAPDCRKAWGPSEAGDCGCCTYTVGEGGDFEKIQDAINALHKSGGEVCIRPGNYYENVVLHGHQNVVISGCGWQTHVYSAALQAGAAGTTDPASPLAESKLPAVFTAVGCTNLEFRSFSIHAATGEVGILLDRGVDSHKSPNTGESGDTREYVVLEKGKGDTDVIIEDLILTASDLPAIVTVSVTGLKIKENRISKSRLKSIWPAVYLSGNDMLFERNWVGLAEVEASQNVTVLNQTTADRTANKLPTQDVSLNKTSLPIAPGGIQIAGPSNNIFVVENEIVGGLYNGITLGNFRVLNAKGEDTGAIYGLKIDFEDMCATQGSITIPGTTTGSNPGKVVAGDLIRNLHIDRNRIHETGMCGIGPVGFFNLVEIQEVISLENVSITGNIISRTLLRALEVSRDNVSRYGGGAICLPDVRNLIIRDNLINDFGEIPGAEVCGIFVLLGENIEISRNQIRETRDLSQTTTTPVNSFGGVRAGILVLFIGPPTQEVADSDSLEAGPPVFAPGLVALRIQENIVRVAIGLALEVFGCGPFEIVGNHFGSGGTVTLSDTPSAGATETLAGTLTVAVVNLGVSMEAMDFSTYTQIYNRDKGENFTDSQTGVPYPSNGGVLFTNNVCQLQAALSSVTGFASMVIFSLDHVLFANNQLWLNGIPGTVDNNAGTLGQTPPGTAFLDAMIFGVTVQVCINRFQESLNSPVLFSGWTVGLFNVTAQNISTYGLMPVPNLTAFKNQNLAIT